MSQLKCQFCHSIANYSGLDIGECFYHKACLVWSDEMLSHPVNDSTCIINAIKRALKTKCSYCNKKGASIKCSEEGCTNQYHYPCAIQAGSVFQKNLHKHYCQEHRSIKYLYLLLIAGCDDAVLNPENMTIEVVSSTFLETMSSKPLPNTSEQIHHDSLPFPSIPEIYPLDNPQNSLVKEYESKKTTNNSEKLKLKYNDNIEKEIEEREDEIEKEEEEEEANDKNNTNNNNNNNNNNNVINHIPKSVFVPTPFSLSSKKPQIEIHNMSDDQSSELSSNDDNKVNKKSPSYSPPKSSSSSSLQTSLSTNNRVNTNNNKDENTIIKKRKSNNELELSSSSVKQNNNSESVTSSNSRKSSKRKSHELPPLKKMKLFYLEKRDFIRVKLVKSLSTLSKGYLISLFGAQSFFDSLRSSRSTELSIDYGIDTKQFVSIYDSARMLNVSVMKIILDDYGENTPVYKILNSMSQVGTVAYIEKELYEIFIVPNGSNMASCGSFALSMERFSRNGEVIAAWCLLINKIK